MYNGMTDEEQEWLIEMINKYIREVKHNDSAE